MDLEIPFNLREEILNLCHRVFREAFNASQADNVRAEYRMFDILNRIQEVLNIASTMEPPFHGGSGGQ
eukprot:14276652-Heterocapsa_arctica.AAC.1